MTNEVHRHYIDVGAGWQEVFPTGEYEFVHTRIENQIFKRRLFEGTLIFGNMKLNRGQGNDYDLIVAADACTNMPYKIECNGGIIWEGYFNYEVDFGSDENNCIVSGTPNVLDEYTCLIKMGNWEYTLLPALGDTTVYAYERTGTPRVEIDHYNLCFGLRDLIDFVLTGANMMGCNDYVAANVVSTLLWLDNFPDATAQATNYITGGVPFEELFIAFLNTIRVASGGATSYWDDRAFTFNKICEWLRKTFQIYWYVDSNNKLRFEHISYFRAGFVHAAHTDVGQLELNLHTTENIKTGLPLDYRSDKWEWDKQKLYSEEQFTMKGADTDDFVGLPITYDEDCCYDFPEKNLNKIEMAQMMTDLQMIIDDGDSVDSSGYMMLACKEENLFRENDDLVNGWINDVGNPYTTFALDLLSPKDITGNEPGAASAVSPGAPGGIAWSVDTFSIVIGETWTLRVDWREHSVGPPSAVQVAMYSATGGVINSNAVLLLAGLNTYTLTMTATGVGRKLRIWDANGFWGGYFWIDKDEDEWVVQWEVGDISAAWRLNNHLSWANLHEEYYQHERVRIEGNMNGVARTVAGANPFLSRAPNKLQKTIKYQKPATQCCSIINSLNYFTTNQGTGYVESLSEGKNSISVDLKYTD